MAETTADVRRDIEMTRERMSTTLAQLEQKLNLMQVIREHPWPAIALAFGAGVALSSTGADVKAAAATVAATKGAGDRLGPLVDRSSSGVKSRLDDAASRVGDHLTQQIEGTLDALVVAATRQIDRWATELKGAVGAPTTTTPSSDGGAIAARVD